LNCWEFKKCGKGICRTCPAYPDNGLECWKVTGTKCGAGKLTMASIEQKLMFCVKCTFYIQYASKAGKKDFVFREDPADRGHKEGPK
jgi:hypothetical protein